MTIEGDCFWFKTGTGFHIFYRKGDGVTIEREPGADPTEEQLWLNGSTYAAIAAINGYLPVHASAVAWQGRAYAFAAPSGSGKSTLAAALGRHGMSLVCDDTMILDLRPPTEVICLPGHKRLKLSDDALILSGAKGQEKVGRMIDKYYARPAGGTVQQALPLAGIFYLESSDAVRCDAISGAAGIARLNDGHYTAQLYALARAEGLAERLAHLADVTSRIRQHRLTMPRDPVRFRGHVGEVAALIKQGAAT